MLTNDPQLCCRTTLSFCEDVSLNFKNFQKKGPMIHLLFDTIVKVLYRFLQPKTVINHSEDLSSITISRNMHLTYKDLVIGDDTSTALAVLKPKQQKAPLLEMRAFCIAVGEYVQLH